MEVIVVPRGQQSSVVGSKLYVAIPQKANQRKYSNNTVGITHEKGWQTFSREVQTRHLFKTGRAERKTLLLLLLLQHLSSFQRQTVRPRRRKLTRTSQRWLAGSCAHVQ
jgi:hypothetical protein